MTNYSFEQDKDWYMVTVTHKGKTYTGRARSREMALIDVIDTLLRGGGK